MDIVERVARAIATEAGASWPQDANRYRRMARGAVLAMREPDDAMLDCGVAFALQASVHGMGGWTNYIAEKHRAMIGAALSRGIETRQGGDGTAPSRSDDSPSAKRRAEHRDISTTNNTQREG